MTEEDFITKELLCALLANPGMTDVCNSYQLLTSARNIAKEFMKTSSAVSPELAEWIRNLP